ncbi:hypothetical protein [Streptomyces sp. NPDC048357]|uniref:hypothetical protein n=1 Tax=Streptomyces sp. NPDC048357 TaxID=3154719 RepID=UPI003413521F
MTGNRRKAMWAVAALCGVTAIGLVVFAAFNLDSADKTASVVAAAAAVADLALATYVVLQALGDTGAGGVRARGKGAIAAGGSISGNAIGARSKVEAPAAPTAPAAPAAPPATPAASPAAAPPQAEAYGDGAVAAAGDVSGNALGDDSEVR